MNPYDIIATLPGCINSSLQILDRLKDVYHDSKEQKLLTSNILELRENLKAFQDCMVEVNIWKKVHHYTQTLLYYDLEESFNDMPIVMMDWDKYPSNFKDTTIRCFKKSMSKKGMLSTLSMENGEDLMLPGAIASSIKYSKESWHNEIFQQASEILDELNAQNHGSFLVKIYDFKDDLGKLNCYADNQILNWLEHHDQEIKKFVDDLERS